MTDEQGATPKKLPAHEVIVRMLEEQSRILEWRQVNNRCTAGDERDAQFIAATLLGVLVEMEIPPNARREAAERLSGMAVSRQFAPFTIERQLRSLAAELERTAPHGEPPVKSTEAVPAREAQGQPTAARGTAHSTVASIPGQGARGPLPSQLESAGQVDVDPDIVVARAAHGSDQGTWVPDPLEEDAHGGGTDRGAGRFDRDWRDER